MIPRHALEEFLARQLGSSVRIEHLRRLPGGQSNPTYYLETTRGDRFAVRSRPQGPLLPSAHAIDREFRVLTALQGTAVPVPRPLAFCADEAVLGSAFYVMEYVEGRCFIDPTLPDVDAHVRSAMYEDMNRVLASLHDLDPAAIGLTGYGKPDRYFERQVRRWTEQYRAAETGPRVNMDRLIEWLPANLPAQDARTALVHGDFRLDNMIFDTFGRVTALLDWELSTLGHPYADLAYQCAQWRLSCGKLRGLQGVDRSALGIPSENAYVAGYCRRRGLGHIDHWTFFLAFSLFRLASICQGVYRRSLDGNAADPAASDFGERVEAIAVSAVELLDQSSSQPAFA